MSAYGRVCLDVSPLALGELVNSELSSQTHTHTHAHDVHILALDVQWNLLMDNSHSIRQLLYLRNVLSGIFSAVSGISLNITGCNPTVSSQFEIMGFLGIMLN